MSKKLVDKTEFETARDLITLMRDMSDETGVTLHIEKSDAGYFTTALVHDEDHPIEFKPGNLLVSDALFAAYRDHQYKGQYEFQPVGHEAEKRVLDYAISVPLDGMITRDGRQIALTGWKPVVAIGQRVTVTVTGHIEVQQKLKVEEETTEDNPWGSE